MNYPALLRVSLAVMFLSFAATAFENQQLEAQQASAGDSVAVVEAIERFHAALVSADTATAMSLLAEDAIVLESGGIESREEYRSHHLAADMEFARTLARERGPIQVRVNGNIAWAASTSMARGTIDDRPINSQGAELMVLRRAGTGWVIDAIHWSSRSIRR